MNQQPRSTAQRLALDLPTLDAAADALEQIREARFGDGVFCVHCDARDVVRWGWQHGRQRYRCQSCRRTFSDLTATPAAYTKRIHRWLPHFTHMGRATPGAAAAADLGVHRNTVWRWRRRTADHLSLCDFALGGQLELTWADPLGRSLLVGASDRGRGFAVLLSYRAAPHVYDAVFADFVLPGSSLVIRDRVGSPLWAAATRAGLPCECLFASVVTDRARTVAWLKRPSRGWPTRPDPPAGATRPHAARASPSRDGSTAAASTPAPSAVAAHPIAGRAGPGLSVDRARADARSAAHPIAGRAGPRLSVDRARAHARSLFSWLRRFRGIEYGHHYYYLAWHNMLNRCGGSPEVFADSCLRSWALRPDPPVPTRTAPTTPVSAVGPLRPRG